jgi:hypothetical protein
MAINVRPLISRNDGIPVKTITLEGLLLTKKTMRDKDVADRIIIERALEVFKLHAGDDDGSQDKAD